MLPSTALDAPQDDAAIAPPMLNAICEEVYLLANEIAALGEDLSNLCAAQMTPELSQRLQLFDPICQRALAQARLLRGVGILLAGNSPAGTGYLKALVEDVPFEQDRQRLRLAMGGLRKEPLDQDAGQSGELDLF